MIQTIPQEQILDHETVEAILKYGPDQEEICARQVSFRTHWKVSVSAAKENHRLIVSGKKIPLLPSLFAGKIGPRHGKDKSYEIFWGLVEKYIPERKNRNYIGLPANQIGRVGNICGGGIVVCEKNRETFEWQQQYCQTFGYNNVRTYRKNIFVWMRRNNFQANIYDLDLMCCASQKMINEVVSGIDRNAPKNVPIIVGVATMIGRHITWKQYKDLMPSGLIEAFRKEGWSIIENKSFYYKDRVVGVQCEYLVIERST